MGIKKFFYIFDAHNNDFNTLKKQKKNITWVKGFQVISCFGCIVN
jgi:hypothetical protein